ncbi:MAG TPA: hypothetical protein VGR00_05395, partial [Thermoanaerobaculia bacterium]|nr:hypothetical protein [Thermoanaerobaculia bacterium]
MSSDAVRLSEEVAGAAPRESRASSLDHLFDATLGLLLLVAAVTALGGRLEADLGRVSLRSSSPARPFLLLALVVAARGLRKEGWIRTLPRDLDRAPRARKSLLHLSRLALGVLAVALLALPLTLPEGRSLDSFAGIGLAAGAAVLAAYRHLARL